MLENLADTLKELIELENGGYKNAKETVKKREELRKYIKDLLIQREELPLSSEFYAGLQKTKGRVSWKAVVEELADKYKIDEKQIEQVMEEYRSEGRKLKYGTRTAESDKVLKQLEFEFMTPEL